MSTERIDLIIVTNQSFPIGMAATNRMLSYAKEIAKKRRVTVLITQPTEMPDHILNKEFEGEINNIHFKYVHKSTIWPKKKSKVFKLFLLLSGIILTFGEIKKCKPKSILIVGINSTFYSIFLRFILQYSINRNKTSIFQEMSEYPQLFKCKSPIQKLDKTLYKNLNGLVIMTKELITFFNNMGQSNCFHLPMTVDVERFNNYAHKRVNAYYIFKYCGGGTYERDGLKNMVMAFIELRELHQNFEFHIIGPYDNNSDYIKSVMQVIETNNAFNYIQFVGPVASDKIPNLLFEADFLIMTPPKNYASGGFPTKLGEYLATSNPVICTNVSEIPLYLNDKNAIIVEPDNHKMLVTTLKKVLNHPDSYYKIGVEGRLVAEHYFTMGSHTEKLINFLRL
ncbi:MAG: glycosyltransferase [Paludibacter sp.]|nr:glycosyltransferase [Paludibacter sp.]